MRLPVLHIVAGAILLLFLGGCTTAALPERPAEITGRVTQLDEELPPRWFVVEASPGSDSSVSSARVSLGRSSRVLRRQHGELVTADALALIRGETVRVWLTGPVAESHPVQATAEAVLVENAR